MSREIFADLPGFSSTMTATKDSWKHEPFVDGRPVPYARQFSREQFASIKRGLVPETMEDKWFIYFDEHLFLHRSWSGEAVYRVSFVEHGEAVDVRDALIAGDELAKFGGRYEAEFLGFLIGNFLLGEDIDFPRPASVRERIFGAFQHMLAGTGYRERRHDNGSEEPER